MMLITTIGHRVKRCTVVLATCLLASYAGLSIAAPPATLEAGGVPAYLEREFAVIKEMLELNAQKMDALSAQLDGVNTELKAEIVSTRQEINDRVELLAADVDEVLVTLNEPDKDIQLTTEVCFDLGASWDWALASKASMGVGWDIGFKIDAFAELTGPGPLPVPALPPLLVTTLPVIPAVSAGVGGNLCVNVPLYSVASNDYWTADFDTQEFDDLVASVAMPAQFLLPGLANVYGKVMPDVTPAIDFLDDGLNLIMPDPGMSLDQARLNAAQSFANLMSSPMLQSMVDESTNRIDETVLDVVDPLCAICWVVPH